MQVKPTLNPDFFVKLAEVVLNIVAHDAELYCQFIVRVVPGYDSIQSYLHQ